MPPSQSEFECWPVLPEGIDGVLIFRTEGQATPMENCFVCGKPMPDAENGETCWGIPGRGVAHNGCYEPGNDDV